MKRRLARAFLDRSRGRLAAVISVLALHATLLAWGAYRDSPTFNEPGHLAAGIEHWQLRTFDLYRVNPPLVRMVAAAPVLAAGTQTDWTHLRDGPGIRMEPEVGKDFIASNGERSLFLVTLGRWACIPFSLLGAIVCFRWAEQLYGEKASLAALVLWCFSPSILAHGRLITPDCGAAALGVAATYAFWRWLRRPTWIRALLAGLALGLAELTKTTWLLLFALWPSLWIITRLGGATPRLPRGVAQSCQLLTTVCVALLILNVGYGFEGSFQKLKTFVFVSEALRGEEDVSSSYRRLSGNRFAESAVGRIVVPFPRDYVIGIDLQKRDFEDFGRPSYLNGRFQEKGWWYYYLYGLAVKTPIGLWLLMILAVYVRCSEARESAAWPDDLAVLLPSIVVMAVVSSQVGFSHHMRYVLPSLPFVFIWASQAAASDRQWVAATAGLAVISSAISSLSVYPHSLSYFNELSGGPRAGHDHLIHSNLDWGQDLLYLKEWIASHSVDESCLYLAYYGGFDPSDVGVDYQLPPRRHATESGEPVNQLQPGVYALSVNFLRGYPWWAPDGTGMWIHVPQNAYREFFRLQPAGTAGYSIYIYHLEPGEYRRRNAER